MLNNPFPSPVNDPVNDPVLYDNLNDAKLPDTEAIDDELLKMRVSNDALEAK